VRPKIGKSAACTPRRPSGGGCDPGLRAVAIVVRTGSDVVAASGHCLEYRAGVAHAYELAVIGGGNMGEALLGGLLDAGWAAPERLQVVEVLAPRRAVLVERFPAVAVADTVGACVGALIAVKPGDVPAAVRAAVGAGARRVLSIAAGVTLATIEAAAGPGVAVVRAMPNTPALVRAGAAAIAAGSVAGEEDLAWAESILAAVGTVVRVPEHLLDAVTGLSGSGPAYVYLVAEALVDAGVLVGLPRATASALVTQLLLGSAQLLARSGELPEVLRANVTSPGGTTAAGLRELEARAVRAAFFAAVQAATERSRQLGA
jgi:pyrroline-5-carboxylate reductase